MDINTQKQSKNENTSIDDCVSQLVETSYAFGYELKSIDIKAAPVEICVDSKETMVDKALLTKYLGIVGNIIDKNYNMLIYRNGKVEYQVNYTDQKCCVYKYKI